MSEVTRDVPSNDEGFHELEAGNAVVAADLQTYGTKLTFNHEQVVTFFLQVEDLRQRVDEVLCRSIVLQRHLMGLVFL